MGSPCAFGYSSGLFIQYLYIVISSFGTASSDFYIRFGQLSYHLFEKEMQAHITFTCLCNIM